MANFFSNPIGIIVVIGLVVVYMGTYLLNKKTPVPEECREIFENTSCKACNNFTCSHKGR